MAFTITGTFTDLTGAPLPNYSTWTQPAQAYNELRGGVWVQVDTTPLAQTTNGSGQYTHTLPLPAVCDPVPLWLLRDPEGFLWQGFVPNDGTTTADLHTLRTAHGWTPAPPQ
jgi:hypothetical protein